MDTLHLFAGGGGGMLGDLLLGHRPRVAVEIEPYCRAVLRHRFPNLEIHDDIRLFDGRPLRGRIDLVAGGFPCQDISVANHRAAGIEGPRSSLWAEMSRVVGEVRPRYVFVENSPMLRTRGLEVVLRDLHLLGYDAAWTVLSAEDVGAPHLRKRMWILGQLADTDGEPLRELQGRSSGPSGSDEAQPGQPRNLGEARPPSDPDADPRGLEGLGEPVQSGQQRAPGGLTDGLRAERPRPVSDADPRGLEEGHPEDSAEKLEHRLDPGSEPDRRRGWGDCTVSFSGCSGPPQWEGDGDAARAYTAAAGGGWWDAEPALGRVADGFPGRVAQLAALGNAQVPAQAAAAFRYLLEVLNH